MADAADHPPPPPALPAHLPGGWRVLRHAAAGGTSHVFEVTRDDGATALLKWGRWRERDIALRFELEAKALRAVGAAWTPALYDHGVLDGWPYLIVERIAGETLAAWMARAQDRGGLGEILALLDQLAAALVAIHAAGIIHRDLKPENVLIGPRGVRVIDFGLAKHPSELGLTQVGAVVGTVHYLAPEQIRGSAVDHRADLYSFGVVAFEALCGRPPFVGERRAIEYQHAVCRPTPVRELRAVPDELDQLIAACLAKLPEDRPASAAVVRAALARAAVGASTARGVAPRALGVRGRVALLWIHGGEPVAVSRAVAEVHGRIARRRGDGLLAVFASLDHDQPMGAALAAADALDDGRARIALHVAIALLRRSPQGKVHAYGEDVDHVERWLPRPLEPGVLLTAAAAELAGDAARPAHDAPGWFRPSERSPAAADDVRPQPPLIGRSGLIESLAAIATQAVVDGRPAHLGIRGAPGSGKSRVVAALRERLAGAGLPVVEVRGARRFLGERPDDALAGALGGGGLATALDRAAERGAVLVIDDAAWLPTAQLRAIDRVIARGDARLAVVTASREPIGDVGAGHRIDVELPALSFTDAEALVREQLRPARLIPNVLIDRLVIRAGGNPGLLVALTGEVTRRGAVRRHPGSDEWYVAADELDTLLAAPSTAWFAVRLLEDLPADDAVAIRGCAALGAWFVPDEVAEVCGADAARRLARLTRAGALHEASGRFAFADPDVQDALHDHLGDEAPALHRRAHRYWLARPDVDALTRLAHLGFHGAAAGDPQTAAICDVALARAARDRGDDSDDAERLIDRALASAPRHAPRLTATALLERARLRYARRRIGEARGDAREVRRLAAQLADTELELEARAVEALAASVADAHDAGLSSARAALADADLGVAARTRALGAIGVLATRAGSADDARPTLQLAAALAEALADRATAIEVARALADVAPPARDD